MLKCSGFKNTKVRSIKSCVCAAEMVSTGGINPALVTLLAIVTLVEILLDNLGQTKFWIKLAFFMGVITACRGKVAITRSINWAAVTELAA